jgi:hypothetical protein
MKKITIWLTATASAIALVIAYQLNAAGVGGKSGDDADHQQPPAAVSTSAAPTVSGSAAPSSSNKSDSDGANTDHVGKPGENK